MPRPARALVASGPAGDERLAVAVEIYNKVADPVTGEPYAKVHLAETVEQAFNGAWTAAQEDATAASLPIDECYLERAGAAKETVSEAEAVMHETDGVLEEVVEAPSSARLSRRQVADDHRKDDALARRRQESGDYRHRQRVVPRVVVAIGALLYGLTDLLLLYVPVLNLPFGIPDRAALVGWLIALILAAAQAGSLEIVLHRHREAERDATDLRDATRDHNRTLFDDPAAATVADRHDLEASMVSADGRLRRSQYEVAALAGITAVLAAVRIALLVREAQHSIAEAALFGAAVGLVLGLLILVMARVLCRGNALGDRLSLGGAIVHETEDRIKDGITEVTAIRDAAAVDLGRAREAKAAGDEVRQAVTGVYWEGMQLAAAWLDVGRPPAFAEGGLRPREMPTVFEADDRAASAERSLQRIGLWLGEIHAIDERAALPAAERDTAGAVATRSVAVARSVRFPGLEVPVTAPPTEPGWLITACAAITVVAAVVAALTGPTLVERLTASPSTVSSALR